MFKKVKDKIGKYICKNIHVHTWKWTGYRKFVNGNKEDTYCCKFCGNLKMILTLKENIKD